jgi:hypothetical protein
MIEGNCPDAPLSAPYTTDFDGQRGLASGAAVMSGSVDLSARRHSKVDSNHPCSALATCTVDVA